jgi:hypothetical protein
MCGSPPHLLIERNFGRRVFVNKRWMTTVKIFMTGAMAAALGTGISGTARADATLPSSFEIASAATQKCAAVQDPTNAFSPVVQQSCNRSLPTQNWHFAQRSGHLIVVSDSNGNCLRSSGNNGSGVFTSPDCLNAPANLQWQFDLVSLTSLQVGELVQISSGRCLDVPGSTTAEGAQLIVFDCHGGNNQIWGLG